MSQQIRDISEVPAIEVITTAAVHLMSAAAVKLGLAAEENAEELKDLDEARKLITALAGLVTAAAPEIGSQHAGPLRDGLRSLQLAFREESIIPDAPGKGPGEKYTGAGQLGSPAAHKQHATAGGPHRSARRRRVNAPAFTASPQPGSTAVRRRQSRPRGAGAAAPVPEAEHDAGRPTATNPAEGPMPSMKTPASGAPSATPPVSAEPYQPMASPRRPSSTRSATFSEADDSTGAHSRPGSSESRHRVQVSCAKPIGMVRAAMPSSSRIGETGRCMAP